MKRFEPVFSGVPVLDPESRKAMAFFRGERRPDADVPTQSGFRRRQIAHQDQAEDGDSIVGSAHIHRC